MPRFYFDVADEHGMVKDQHGLILPNASAAIAEARLSARDFAIEDLRDATAIGKRKLIVRDHHNKTLFECSVRDVVSDFMA
jgi:hypothetical protein